MSSEDIESGIRIDEGDFNDVLVCSNIVKDQISNSTLYEEIMNSLSYKLNNIAG